MTDIRTVRASGPADLLALVPGLLGFHPQDSVVLLTVGGAAEPFHARVDLPTDPVGAQELAGYLVEVAGRHEVTAVALVVYTQDRALAGEFSSELAARLCARGLDLVCAARADGERWWRIDGPHDDGPGTPYDVSSHPLMAQTVLDGTAVLGSRRELADSLVGTDPDEIERVGRLADEVVERLVRCLEGREGPHTGRRFLVVEGRWVQRRVRRHLRDGDLLDAHDAARLLVLVMSSLQVRDVAWAEMNRETAERHVGLWRDLVRRAPLELRAAPAALLGFAAWLSGDGALAWCAVDCAQQAEPGYGLAGLLTDALAGAVPPSAWRPLPPEALTLFAEPS